MNRDNKTPFCATPVGGVGPDGARRLRQNENDKRRRGCQADAQPAAPSSSCAFDSTNRWFAQRYNVNNAWIFNGNNRMLNNNNVNNGNQVGAVANLSTSDTTQTKGFTEQDDAERFASLYATMKRTRRNKRRGRDAVEYEANWVANLVRGMEERKERTLRIDRNSTFLTPTPRWREIFATCFDGRMIDHELCDVIIPAADTILSPYTFNNRKGKGAQAAINQLMENIYEVTEGFTRPARIVKIDFRGFFPSALWNVAERVMCDAIDTIDGLTDDYRAYLHWLAMIAIHANPAAHCERRSPAWLWQEHIDPEKSLFNKPEGVGAAIGRLSWQTAMGLYINDEIHWLTEECGLKVVVFVDDMVFVVPEEQHPYLLSLLPELRRRLTRKGVRLNERKFYDQPFQHGCEFLGTHIRPNRLHLNNKTYRRAVHTVRQLNAAPYKGIDRMLSVFNSYGGLLKNRTDHHRLLTLRDLVMPAWQHLLCWDARRQCLTPQPPFAERERLKRKYSIHLNTKHHDTIREAAAA